MSSDLGVLPVVGHVGHAGSSTLLVLEWWLPIILIVVATRVSRRRDVWALCGAAAALMVAASPPVHGLAQRSVTGHMVQHLVIILLASPLLALPLAQAPTRLRAWPPIRRLAEVSVHSSLAPVVAGVAHAGAVVAWHHPVLYDAAMRQWIVHGIEHQALLLTGVWWWAAVFHHALRRQLVAPLVSLFVVATVCAMLGAVLMFAPSALYAQGGVLDQQLAGALMAGIAGSVYAATGLVMMTALVRRLATPRNRRIPPSQVAVSGTAAASGRPRASGPRVMMSAGLIAAAASVIGVQLQPPALEVPPESPLAADPMSPEERLGEHLYRRDCVSCHGIDGEGSFRGIPIEDVGTSSMYFVLSTGRMPIAAPDDEIRRQDPAYTPAEIDAVIAYTSRFVDGPELPQIDTATADLARGGVQYRLHCAACHSATGIGGAQAFGREAPPVLESTALQTAAAVVAGPGPMPAFSFTEDELSGLAAYVEFLQDPPTTGVPIPGGRVGEGLLAWLLGVGLLLGFVSWVGRRA